MEINNEGNNYMRRPLHVSRRKARGAHLPGLNGRLPEGEEDGREKYSARARSI